MSKRTDEMRVRVEEAHKALITLNDQYNDLLTREHEKQMKKKGSRSLSVDDEKKVVRLMTIDMIILIGVISLELAGVIDFFVGTLIILGKTFVMKSLVARVGEKDNRKNNIVPQKDENKDELFERTYQARELYHKLRKEYESMLLNEDIENSIDEETEVVARDEGLEDKVELYQIYSEYIQYVKDLSVEETGKMYELTNRDQKFGRIN